MYSFFHANLLIFLFFYHMYEWKHRGSAHIYGFLWFSNALKMDEFNWIGEESVIVANFIFNSYITPLNPCPIHQRNFRTHRTSVRDPCLFATPKILSSNEQQDDEDLVNYVQRHTNCHSSRCLLKRKNST